MLFFNHRDGFLRGLQFLPPIKLTATHQDITEILLNVAQDTIATTIIIENQDIYCIVNY